MPLRWGRRDVFRVAVVSTPGEGFRVPPLLRLRPSTMTERSAYSSRLGIAMLVSAGAHAALLAWVSIDMPQVPSARIELVRRTTADLDRPEPSVQVVEIRMPGVRLPGGTMAAGTSPEGSTSRGPGGAIPLETAVTAPPVRSIPTLDRHAAVMTAHATSPAGLDLPALADSASGMEKAAAAGRPARGVVLRPAGKAPGASAETHGSSGSGGLGGIGGGVTIVGPGGDCITPGESVPDGRRLPSRVPGLEPGRGGRSSRSPTRSSGGPGTTGR